MKEEEEEEEGVAVSGDECGRDTNTAPATTQCHDGPVANLRLLTLLLFV